MRYSSAAQLKFEYETPGSSLDSATADTAGIRSNAGNTETAQSPLVRSYDPIYAANARIAGRINAASITEREHQELLKERQNLLTKKFEGTISRQESNRLEYVRWSLDRVEDAKYGHVLEALDSAVARYESILDQLKALGIKLEGNLPRRKR